MRIIVEGEQDVLKLMGKQHIKDSKYRLMKYLLRGFVEEGVLLHNTISGQMILLDVHEAELLDDISSLPLDIIKTLVERYFLVPIDYNEEKLVLSLRYIFRQIKSTGGINGYLILPTTKCNARCSYCFEKNIRRVTMSSDMAQKTINFISNNRGNRPVTIHWFGGEPLMGEEYIDQICSGLSNLNIPYASIMTSNGYLFTDNTIKKAVNNWKLRKVQITLDGTEHAYNRIKAYVNVNDNAYRKVLNNVNGLAEQGIDVSLRLNVDEINKKDITKLAEELCLEFKNTARVSIYASLITKDKYCYPTSDYYENKRLLYESVCSLNDMLLEKGKLATDYSLLSLKYHACMADDAGMIVIHPDGKFSRCERVTDEDTYGQLGINMDGADRVVKKYMEVLKLDSCKECPLFPACLNLAACPNSSNIEWYVCNRTIRREELFLVRQYNNHFREAQEKKYGALDTKYGI